MRNCLRKENTSNCTGVYYEFLRRKYERNQISIRARSHTDVKKNKQRKVPTYYLKPLYVCKYEMKKINYRLMSILSFLWTEDLCLFWFLFTEEVHLTHHYWINVFDPIFHVEIISYTMNGTIIFFSAKQSSPEWI